MKRLRIFAGPNGSGKSTIIKVVTDAGVHLGLYINADEYKKELNKTHCFNFSNLNIIHYLQNIWQMIISPPFLPIMCEISY